MEQPDSSHSPTSSQTSNSPEPSESTASSSRPTRARWLRVARRVYLAALGIALLVVVVINADDVVEVVSDARLGWLILAALMSCVSIVPNSGVWTQALRALGQQVTLRQVVTATARALPARYIPTGFNFAIARGALLRSAAGIGVVPLGLVAALEMALSVAVAGATGIVILALVGTLPASWVWLAAVVIGLVVAVSPPVSQRVLGWIARRVSTELPETSWTGWARVVGALGIYWALASVTFAVYLSAFPAADGIAFAKAIGAFMLAWAVGFLAVLAPQGLGVAEAGLVALLAVDGLDASRLLLIFAGYRLLLVFRDLTIAFGTEVVLRLQTPQESQG